MNKKGTTLIETVMSIFLISVVVVAFLEALNVGITGTLNLSRKTSALNLAKSQIEYVKSQPTYNGSSGDLESVYDLITTGDDLDDVVNYDITGQVSNVSANISVQQITVNVSYLNGKEVQLTGYKAARESSSTPIARGQVVTDVIEDFPHESPGGWSIGCWFGEDGCGTWTGYYHTFTTSTRAKISATWKFEWTNDLYDNYLLGEFTWGAAYIGIYAGKPSWAEGDYDDGVVFRGGSDSLSGCMPGLCSCDPDVGVETAPIAVYPPSCSWDVSIDNWTYEHDFFLLLPVEWYSDGTWYHTGTFEFTVTTASAVDPGQYTVFFFNGEDRISYQTISATVTFVY